MQMRLVFYGLTEESIFKFVQQNSNPGGGGGQNFLEIEFPSRQKWEEMFCRKQKREKICKPYIHTI